MTHDIYDLEKIARDLVKKSGGDANGAAMKLEPLIEKYDLTGDQISTINEMIVDIACGLEL